MIIMPERKSLTASHTVHPVLASFYLYGTNAILENLTIENSFDESINVTINVVAAYIRGDMQQLKLYFY